MDAMSILNNLHTSYIYGRHFSTKRHERQNHVNLISAPSRVEFSLHSIDYEHSVEEAERKEERKTDSGRTAANQMKHP
jgi:hypothetical protein